MTHETEPTAQSMITDALLHGVDGLTVEQTHALRTNLRNIAFAARTVGATDEEAIKIASELHVSGEISVDQGGIEGALAYRARFCSTPWRDA